MKLMAGVSACLVALAAVPTSLADGNDGVPQIIPRYAVFRDASGLLATVNLAGPTDTATNPFFQSIGTNGRSCVSCHQPSAQWTITPRNVRERFAATHGTDPIFRPVDGAGCPTMDVSSEQAREHAYTLLLNKGLIRIEIDVPQSAEFWVQSNDNPYGCTSATAISIYRRPPPATNLNFLSTVMWDGRETLKDSTGALKPVRDDLIQQATDATLIHAQAAAAPTDAQLNAIVDFELQLYSAQLVDRDAGYLAADGALGGPRNLLQQPFFIGINDPLGGNPTGAAFSPTIFSLYGNWANLARRNADERRDPDIDAARAAVARGQTLFNTLSIPITGVAGLNDVLNVPVIQGFCGTCHDTPNAGDHSIPAPLNIGLVGTDRATPDLPLLTLVNKLTGAQVQVTDPGRALITGKWADIGKFKGPVLRGLAARAPYFHNGSAAALSDVITFYNTRFNLNLTAQQQADLIAFLRTL
jgi:cytochrome c peroxidase